jgi:hypothetical protein
VNLPCGGSAEPQSFAACRLLKASCFCHEPDGRHFVFPFRKWILFSPKRSSFAADFICQIVLRACCREPAASSGSFVDECACRAVRARCIRSAGAIWKPRRNCNPYRRSNHLRVRALILHGRFAEFSMPSIRRRLGVSPGCQRPEACWRSGRAETARVARGARILWARQFGEFV